MVALSSDRHYRDVRHERLTVSIVLPDCVHKFEG